MLLIFVSYISFRVLLSDMTASTSWSKLYWAMILHHTNAHYLCIRARRTCGASSCGSARWSRTWSWPDSTISGVSSTSRRTDAFNLSMINWKPYCHRKITRQGLIQFHNYPEWHCASKNHSFSLGLGTILIKSQAERELKVKIITLKIS